MTVSLEKTTTRPTIDFGTDSRETAREYAAAADSRVLPDEVRPVLQAAARGEVVDAYDLNLALHHAMSSASTRLGQSMARRTLTSKIRHLVYIVNGVIQNHIDEVPVYEGGPRSPRIHALEIEVEHAGVVNQSLTNDLTEAREKLRQAQADLRDSQRRAETSEGAFEALKAAANDEITRLGQAVNHNLDVAVEALGDRDTLGAVLCYALEFLDAETRQRVFGYWDGVATS